MIELRKYQEPSYLFLVNALTKYGSAIDASDTGVGKTYVAIKVAEHLKMPVLVMCPKSMIGKWKELLAKSSIAKYEVISVDWCVRHINEIKERKEKGLLIWDECHRGQANYNTKTVKNLSTIRQNGYFVLLLSATAISNPLRMRATASILGLCEPKNYFKWIFDNGCRRKIFGGFEFHGGNYVLSKIHKAIFDVGKGVRLRIKDLPAGEFPENDIYIEKISASDEYMRKIVELESEMRYSSDSEQVLGDIMKMRQLLEESKLDEIKDEAIDLLEEDKSVVIFLSFLNSIGILRDKLSDYNPLVLTGDVDEEARKMIIDDFQCDRRRIIICQLAVGGVGLSLHDINGQYPRVALINPDFSAVHLKQALGRIYRQGGKSRCIQKLYVVSDTLEERILTRLKKGISEIALGNEGALENEDLMEVFEPYKKKNKKGGVYV